MEYAIGSLICAASLAGYMALFHLYTRATRRLESAEATLAAKASGLHELIAENIEMGQRLDKLQETEIEFYQLRREHARTSSMLQHLARVEAGLRLEVARLHELHMSAKA
jgi:Tfp pilus assembly protein PilN